jgi:hypothetical protein
MGSPLQEGPIVQIILACRAAVEATSAESSPATRSTLPDFKFSPSQVNVGASISLAQFVKDYTPSYFNMMDF